MIVTDRWIFVHVPKTGGQSVTRAIGFKSRMPTHTPLHAIDKGERFAFGFIRNPWARMVSLYRFMCQRKWKHGDPYDPEAIRKAGFREWLLHHPFVMREDVVTVPLQNRSQMYWLAGCDFIGRTEDMPSSFRAACLRAGIKGRTLPHINRTRGGDWRLEYDDTTAEHVARHFAADIAFGGYEWH